MQTLLMWYTTTSLHGLEFLLNIVIFVNKLTKFYVVVQYQYHKVRSNCL